MAYRRPVEFGTLIGLTIKSFQGGFDGSECIRIETECGRAFVMHHEQSCCEHVEIADFIGDADDLIGHPVVSASVESEDGDEEYSEWTFYKLDTQRGGVTIRWYGSSNGFYSIAVNFEEILSDVQRHLLILAGHDGNNDD